MLIQHNKSGPVGGFFIALTDGILRTAECGVFVLSAEPVAVELGHQQLGSLVADFPKRHDKRLDAGSLEGALEPEYTIAIQFTDTGLASGEDDELGSTEVEQRDFLCGEYAVLYAWWQIGCTTAKSGVSARHEQSASTHGVYIAEGALLVNRSR